MVAEPEFSVVIPSYNRRESLVRVLHALCERPGGTPSFEVIVVLDGSSDGSREALAELPVPFELRVIEQPNRGASSARNAGAAVARGQFLLFLDDDILLAPGALSAHKDIQSEIGGGCVLGDVINEAVHRGLPEYTCNGWAPEQLRKRGPVWTDLYTGHLSIPRVDFARIGGFDESLRRLEDLEFGFRCGEGELKFVFTAAASGRQVFSKTARECLLDRTTDGEMTARLYRRDPRIVAMTTKRRPQTEGSIRPLVLRAAATMRMPTLVAGALGALPLWVPGSRAVFASLNAHAYLRGVRREMMSWRDWCEYFNRSGGWLE